MNSDPELGGRTKHPGAGDAPISSHNCCATRNGRRLPRTRCI